MSDFMIAILATIAVMWQMIVMIFTTIAIANAFGSGWFVVSVILDIILLNIIGQLVKKYDR